MVALFRLSIAFLALLASVGHSKGDDVVSRATGIDAIRDLALIEEYRNAIEVSPNQLLQLRQLLDNPDIKKAANEGKSYADRLVQSRVAAILTDEQVRAMRISYLKRRFPSALLVFRSELLEQIGADEIHAEEAATRSESAHQAFIKLFNAEFQDRLKSIATELTVESQRKLQQFFGPDLFPEPSGSVSFDVKDIALFEEDQDVRLYNMLKVLDVGKRYELTADQKAKLRALGMQANSQRKSGPSAYKQFFADGIREILRPDQHVGIVQRSHEMLLRLDLATLTRPQVVKFIGIEIDRRDAFRTKVDRFRAELVEMRSRNERRIFNESVAIFPRDRRDLLVRLFEDVW